MDAFIICYVMIAQEIVFQLAAGSSGGLFLVSAPS